MARLKGLGRGLDALLSGDNEAANRDELQSLALDRIRSGRYQPRTRMDEASLAELAQSIKAQGVMQPILVRPVDGGHYEIVAGERRWRAALHAGLKEIPALVREALVREARGKRTGRVRSAMPDAPLDLRLAAIGLTALLDGLWLEWCLEPGTFRPAEAIALCEAWVDNLVGRTDPAALE